MLPLYHDPHFTFRFADDRLIPRFHLEGVEAGRWVEVFKIDPGTGEWLCLLATATLGEGGGVELEEPIIVLGNDGSNRSYREAGVPEGHLDAKPRKQTPKGRKVYYENLAGRSQGRHRLETENPLENHGASTPWPSHDIREGKGGAVEACQVPRLDTMGRCSRWPPDR
jgi:hypothetical protein